MKIGDNIVESIIVTSKEDEVLCIISDTEIIEQEGYKVILEPVQKILS